MLRTRESGQLESWLAWQAIDEEADDLRLDETQKCQLSENLQKARRDLKEAVESDHRSVRRTKRQGNALPFRENPLQ